MGYQTGIADALRDWGLTVVEVPGWQTRGSSSFDPKGFVAHHDVIGPATTVPSIIIDGRSDLPGPLSQFWLERNGRVHLVAAGRANHAGEGGWRGLSGNSSVWGCEANNLGTAADPWPEVQLDAYVRLAAACADFSGFDASYVCGHKEWAPDRKVDPHSIDMGTFRGRVAAASKETFSIVDKQTKDYFDRKFARRRDAEVTILSHLRTLGRKAGVAQKDLDAIQADIAALTAED